jgi:hypothetical protein
MLTTVNFACCVYSPNLNWGIAAIRTIMDDDDDGRVKGGR